ncbi:hypothetical protein [Clostridium sp.]|uniref:hypothetical protein n=1 Tax=Clostridium sp. TaxID=1506 RepID=UPI001B53C381|nr:hypothetical protein [Clostridium sp.]MBP3915911.1 hypothetical protein [Clostridium sp.]MBP3928057.1 hypothetical protein [Peptostreptococcaceae bacterium]
MILEFEFLNEVERDKIINENETLYLIEVKYLKNKNLLVFSDIPTLEILQQEQGNKISILEAENSALLESQKVQDRTIVENDMRMMDLEWALEDLITSINPTAKINLTEVFTMFGRSSTYFNQLKQMIEMENYDSKEDMERILNKYAAGSRPRITQEEYDQLFDLLYPPVYDIPTTIPEV